MALTIYNKTETYGLDRVIKDIQSVLANRLKWNGEVSIYGRLQRTERDNKTHYEYWINNNEYKRVFIDDNVAGVIGFVLKGRDIEGYNIVCEVDCIVTVNLKKIYTDTERQDEKALYDVKNTLERCHGLSLLDIREGIADVFSDITTEDIKHRDMHPYYVFSLTFEIKYTDDDCTIR